MSIPVETCSGQFALARLQKLAALEQNHFWFVGRRRLVLDRVDRWMPRDDGLVADLGCGTGSLVTELARRGRRVIGLDLRSEGVTMAPDGAPSGRQAQADITHLPIRSAVLSGALLIDVLEHVDAAVALSEASRALRSGGVLIATVPALPRLWSRRDADAGHLRRYTRGTLRESLENAGLTVLDMCFYQCLLLPILAVSRMMGRTDVRWRDAEDNVPSWLNAAFAAVNRLEVQMGGAIQWPIGSSLVAVAAKR